MQWVTNVVLSYFPGSCRQPWLVHSVKYFPIFLQQSSLWILYIYIVPILQMSKPRLQELQLSRLLTSTGRI